MFEKIKSNIIPIMIGIFFIICIIIYMRKRKGAEKDELDTIINEIEIAQSQ